MIKAKKSLGQNFLKDEAILQRIIENAKLSENDTVLEIGPGTGALTERLIKICKKVIAVELDDRLVTILQNKFKNHTNLDIIHDDILKINLPKLVSNYKDYKVIANIPYYITAPIIRLLLETKFPPSEMILMVQKEVAERIAAKPGKMSILAVAVQYYSQSKYLFMVPKAAFDPMPKVDSAVIKISSITASFQRELTSSNKPDEAKKFFRVVRAGFSAKRKTLANNLSSSLQLDKETIEEKLRLIRLPENVRAQELKVEDWVNLQKTLEK